MLLRGFDLSQLHEVGAHSLKATCLSWCAKAGTDRGHRRLLGYHVKRDDKSMETYSRDGMAAPLRDLKHVIDMIGDGSFDPDSTRSGFFAEKPTGEPVLPSGAGRATLGQRKWGAGDPKDSGTSCSASSSTPPADVMASDDVDASRPKKAKTDSGTEAQAATGSAEVALLSSGRAAIGQFEVVMDAKSSCPSSCSSSSSVGSLLDDEVVKAARLNYAGTLVYNTSTNCVHIAEGTDKLRCNRSLDRKSVV